MSESTSVKFADGTRDRLKAMAESKRRTSNWLVREAVEQYLQREEAEIAFAREADEAWVDYKSTGLHLTHAEVDAWLEKLENGEEAELPPAHK